MSAVLDQTAKPAAVSSLAQLRHPQPEAQMPVVTMGFGSLQSFDLMQRGAKLLAASTLVPKEYQNNLPNCVIALNMAQRIGADPLMVMQNLYVVHGRPAWSAQFLIATFNQCGRFTAMRFEFVGEQGKDSWGCRAWAIEKSTGEKIIGSGITIQLAKDEGWYQKGGSKWKTMPEQMLMYRAASWLVRAYAPEIAMGLQTGEEVRDVYDADNDGDGNFVVSSVTDLKTGERTAIDKSTGEIVAPAGEAEPSAEVDIDALIKEAEGLAQKGSDLCLDLCRNLPIEEADRIRAIYKTKAAEAEAASTGKKAGK